MGTCDPGSERPGGLTARCATGLLLLAAVLPGCVVVPVYATYDGPAAGLGAALGGAIGAALDQATAPYPPPGAVWDPVAGVWRLP